ncbi:hypothetical protein N7478_010260 [Penicillium angulare]|uniref:uncharacterized protein n=1 Tax=Penicillium angulare TaxID=116970 RepID=UPI002541A09F|nr:uncharacterized protein N7478_010260 [Penicillium angulare]KAJ5267452.1 hypothetical protein N7478_010260 [Penicillium angulare]
MVTFNPFSLSSLDHALLAVYIPQNLCFRTTNHQQCLSQLQDGIKLLLDNLPFLSGEVVPWTDSCAKPGEMRVQPGTTFAGIPMLTIKHFKDVILPPVLIEGGGSSQTDQAVAALDGEYFPLPLILPPSEPRPVMRLQANVMADGVILSMAFSHSVFDGTGTGRIHEMLAECCRAAATQTSPNLPTDEKKEELLRHVLTTAGEGEHPEIDHSGEVGQSYAYESKEDGEAGQAESMELLGTGLATRAFILSPEKLERLRKACSELLPLLTRLSAKEQKEWPTFLSSNDVLTGAFAFCIEKARKENGIDMSSKSRHLTFAVNFRKRLQAIPDCYLGNAVFPSRIYFQLPTDSDVDLDTLENSLDLQPLQESGINVRDLLEIANQAFQSRVGISSYDDAFLRSFMAFMTKQEDYEATNLRYGNLIASSWRDLKINSLDFGPGLGHVDNFELNIGVADGAMTVLPEVKRDLLATKKKAPWDVRVSLANQTMGSFQQNTLIAWLADKIV